MNEFIFATLGLQAFPCGKSGERNLLFWAFPHIYVRSGYILGATTFASLVTRLLKRSLAPKNIKKEPPASLRPKGSLSLTQNAKNSAEICCYSISNILGGNTFRRSASRISNTTLVVFPSAREVFISTFLSVPGSLHELSQYSKDVSASAPLT